MSIGERLQNDFQQQFSGGRDLSAYRCAPCMNGKTAPPNNYKMGTCGNCKTRTDIAHIRDFYKTGTQQ